MLTCVECGSKFERRGSRGPVPKYCSTKCSSAVQRRRPERREYERLYRAAERASGSRRKYEYEYNRRPEVMARNAERMRIKWHTDPEYRGRQLARWGDQFPGVVLSAPYTGHLWLDMARQVVGDVDPDSMWREYRYDEMGEALLALLEGKDPKEAVSQFRKQEFGPRYLEISMSEFKSDPDEHERYFDRVMPSHPSAEDEVVARETVGYYVETPYHHGENGRPMVNRQQQPSRRRMKDAGWQKHAKRIARV